ncbi:MAG: hypothetical protein U1E56_02040 [Bauldia sp.]|mgnify:CR=1 FL=1
MEEPLMGGNDDGTFVPFTDILFNALLGFAVMVFVAFSLINPAAKAGNVELKADFIISVQWPDFSPDDIDTYVQDPAGNIVWYHQRDIGLMHLDRDDRGNYRDSMTVDGQIVANPLNQEIITLRGVLPGEYIVNVYDYASETKEPVDVNIKVEKINPALKVLTAKTVTLKGKGDEQTAARFTIASDNSVAEVAPADAVPQMSLVNKLLQPKR